MIRFKNVEKQYKRDDEIIFALKKANIIFPDKGMICIFGESGSGKSTILKLISSLEKPSSGDILFEDKFISKFNETESSNYLLRNISFVFQEDNFLNDYSIKNNILISLNKNNKNNDQVIKKSLKKVDLEHFEERKPDKISGGERQRVAIARSIAKDSKIILADEPTGSLDEENSHIIFNLLKEEAKKKLVIVVTHNEEIAKKYLDYYIRIDNGNILENTIKYYQIKEKMTEKENHFKKYSTFLLAVNFLKNSKIKVMVAFLLFLFLFTFFGIIFGTFLNDPTIDGARKIVENNDNSVILRKNKLKKFEDLVIKDTELQFIDEFDFSKSIKQYNRYIYLSKDNGDSFSNLNFEGFVEFDNNLLKNFDYKLIHGKMPEKNVEDNEVVLTLFMVKILNFYKFFNESVKDYKTLLNKEISLSFSFLGEPKKFKIIGIIDTNFSFNKSLYSMSNDEINITKKRGENTIHTFFFFRSNFYKENFPEKLYSLPVILRTGEEKKTYDLISTDFKKYINNIFMFDDKKSLTKLERNEMILTVNLSKKNLNFISDETKVRIRNYAIEYHSQIKTLLDSKFSKETDYNDYYEYILNNKFNEFDPKFSYDFFYKESKKSFATRVLPSKFKDTYIIFSGDSNNKKEKVKIVGCNIVENGFLNSFAFIDETLFSKVVENAENLEDEVGLTGMILPLNKKYDDNLKMIRFSKNVNINSDVYIFKFTNFTINEINLLSRLVNEIKEIFLYISITFLILSFLYSIYFFKNLFVQNKKRIGFIFLNGFSKRNVLSILFFQTGFIIFLSFLISILLSYISLEIIQKFVISSKFSGYYTVIFNLVPLYLLFFGLLLIILSIIYPFIKFLKTSKLDFLREE